MAGGGRAPRAERLTDFRTARDHSPVTRDDGNKKGGRKGGYVMSFTWVEARKSPCPRPPSPCSHLLSFELSSFAFPRNAPARTQLYFRTRFASLRVDSSRRARLDEINTPCLSPLLDATRGTESGSSFFFWENPSWIILERVSSRWISAREILPWLVGRFALRLKRVGGTLIDWKSMEYAVRGSYT